MSGESWIRFEGYEGRVDPGYKGTYGSAGLRYPLIERTRTWDIVRVDGEPDGGIYRQGNFVVLSRGHDMMKKAHEEAAAYRLHFKRCPGVGVCEDIGHPGGPKRSHAQRLTESEAHAPGAPTHWPAVPAPDQPPPTPPAVTTISTASLDPDAWIEHLRPSGAIVTRHVAFDLELAVIPLTFGLRPGPPLGMAEDCNKRGGRVIGDQDELSCAEVEIVKRLRRAGWEAAWFQAFKCGRRRWSAYIADAVDLPPAVQHVQRHAGGSAGHPDVIAWRGERVVAIESKGPGDRLKDSQIQWFARARDIGVRLDDMAVVEWRVTPPG